MEILKNWRGLKPGPKVEPDANTELESRPEMFKYNFLQVHHNTRNFLFRNMKNI